MPQKQDAREKTPSRKKDDTDYLDYLSKVLLERARARISPEENNLISASSPNLYLQVKQKPDVSGYAIHGGGLVPNIEVNYPINKYGISDNIPLSTFPITPENIATHELQHFSDAATRAGDISGFWDRLAKAIGTSREYPKMMQAHKYLQNLVMRPPSWLSPMYANELTRYDPEYATEYTASLAEHNWKPLRMPAMKGEFSPENIRDALQSIALYLTQGP